MKVLTQYAEHANMIADTFRAAFAKSKIGPFTVTMTAPKESTGGGEQALQHVTLTPASGMALVIGTINAKEKRAELRNYEHVTKIHRERFKTDTPFDEAAYKELLEKAQGVLGAFDLETIVADAPPVVVAPVAVADPTEQSLPLDTGDAAPLQRTWVWIAVLALCVAFAAGAVWYALQL
jgi:hypothetical protein